jgi:hypothetical protein
MIRGYLSFGAEPGRFHARPIVPIELDDGVPARVIAAGIRSDVVLNVATQFRQPLRHRAVLMSENRSKPFLGDIRPPVEDDEKFEHGLGSEGNGTLNLLNPFGTHSEPL